MLYIVMVPVTKTNHDIPLFVLFNSSRTKVLFLFTGPQTVYITSTSLYGRVSYTIYSSIKPYRARHEVHLEFYIDLQSRGSDYYTIVRNETPSGKNRTLYRSPINNLRLLQTKSIRNGYEFIFYFTPIQPRRAKLNTALAMAILPLSSACGNIVGRERRQAHSIKLFSLVADPITFAQHSVAKKNQ